MKKAFKYLIIVFIALLVFADGCAFANPNPTKVENLKNYDFDSTGNQDISATKSVFTLFLYLLLFVGISVLAYFTTKWIAKTQRKAQIKSKYMEVIDSLPLGADRGIYLIRAPQGILMIGVTAKGITTMGKLSDEETELIYEAEISSPDFNKSFAGHLNQFLHNMKNSMEDKHGDLR